MCAAGDGPRLAGHKPGQIGVFAGRTFDIGFPSVRFFSLFHHLYV